MTRSPSGSLMPHEYAQKLHWQKRTTSAKQSNDSTKKCEKVGTQVMNQKTGQTMQVAA